MPLLIAVSAKPDLVKCDGFPLAERPAHNRKIGNSASKQSLWRRMQRLDGDPDNRKVQESASMLRCHSVSNECDDKFEPLPSKNEVRIVLGFPSGFRLEVPRGYGASRAE